MEEEAEQIINAAKSVLPLFIFQWFENELREIIKHPFVQDWHARSVRMFEPLMHSDDLTRRLFRFFQIHRGSINRDLSFLESAYLHFDSRTYRRFFAKMMEFASLWNDRVGRQVVGNHLLEIIREREGIHRSECEASGTYFPFRFYEKFKALFEIYLVLNIPRYEQLLYILYDHKSRGSPNNAFEIRRLRFVALEFFGQNEFLTNRLLYYCTGDSVGLDSVAPIGLNHPLSNFQLRNNPTPVSTSTVRQGIPYSNPTLPVTNNYHPQCSSTTQTTALDGKNHLILGHPFPYSPKPDSATSVERSIRGMRIPVSVFPVGPFYPAHHASSGGNLSGKHYPVPDLRTPGYQLNPVEPSYDPRASKHSSPIGWRSPVIGYLGPLITGGPQLNDATVPINQLPGSAESVEESRATMEEPNSVSAESLGNGGTVPTNQLPGPAKKGLKDN